MSAREDACTQHQQKRWMRPDAHRWLRSDVARFLVPGAAASAYSDSERKYSPNQPRVPAGSGRESGRWTDGGGNGNGSGANPAALPTGNNVVRIPILKHYDISGWYSKPNRDFGGLTPRDYLRDKGAAERRQVGLDALIRFGVLKP